MGTLKVSERAKEWFERAGRVATVEVKVVGSGWCRFPKAVVTAGKPEDESGYDLYTDGENKLYVPKNLSKKDELKVDLGGLWIAREPEVEGISLF